MELSQKLKLVLFSTSSCFINLNNNYPLNELLFICSDEEIICSDEEKDRLFNLNIKAPNIFRFLYFNMKVFHQILYKNDAVIKLDKTNFDEKFINYFYLAKLIEEEQNALVNYEFKIDFIENLSHQKSKGIFYDIIIAKIINILIDNYKGSDEYIEENDDSLLTEIIEKHLKKKYRTSIGNYEISYDQDKIKNEKLDKIYIDIVINALLKSGKIEEKNDEEKVFFSNFIEQLDLKNVEITQTMMEELNKFFEKEESKKKYNILKSEDLFNKSKINFFYNLFQYIFKDNFFISQNTFLSELRKNIINILRKENEIQSKLFNNSKTEEKFEYVINFITYSKFFYDKFISKELDIKTSEKNIYISFISSEGKASRSNLYNDSNQTMTTDITENISKEEEIDFSKLIKNESNDYIILKFTGKTVNKKDEVTKQIIHLNDGKFLDIDNNCIGATINEDNGREKNKNENENVICSISSEIGNLIVKEIEGTIKEDDYTVKNELKLSKEKFDSIKEISNTKEYIKTGLMSFLVNYYDNNKINDNSESGYIKLNFNAITKIDEDGDLYAFVSNDIYDNSQNKLVFYYESSNFKTQVFDGTEAEKGKLSFNIGNNALFKIDIDANNKLLLCACKSYVPGYKNGILIIKIEIKRDKKTKIENYSTKHYKFDDTFDFEVNCFCKIYENKEKSFSYILVGGFEVEKRRGMVKLYKISYKGENIKLEFVQDAIEDYFDFCGLIDNIVRPDDKKRSIIISCFPGTDYEFNLPKNDDYIDILEEFLAD